MGPDLSALLARAEAAGLSAVVSCATNPASVEVHRKLIGRFPLLQVALGLHPEELISLDRAQAQACLRSIEEHLPGVTAVGEVGLDFKYGAAEAQRALQAEFFSQFIALAKKHDKPLNVHSRRAERQTLEQLISEGATRVLMHWFTGSSKLCKLATQQGYFISCGPSLLTNELTQGVVKGIPLENLLLETDAPVPYTLPGAAPAEGPQPSEPSWIPRVAAKVAEVKGCSLTEVETQTWKNAKTLWGLR